MELLQLADLVDLQPAELRLPMIERRLADPYRPDKFRHGSPISACFTMTDLLRPKTAGASFDTSRRSPLFAYWL